MALAPAQATLAKRLAAAKSRITTTARATIETSAAEPKTTPKPAPRENAKAKSTAHETKNQAEHDKAKAAKGKGKRGRATGDRVGGASDVSLPDRLRQMAENPAALAFISDAQLVEIFDAMVSNAATKGSTGAMDRQALFRAAGLPFQGGIGARSGAGRAKATGAEIAGRLEAALNRSRGRSAVTRDAEPGGNDVETAA